MDWRIGCEKNGAMIYSLRRGLLPARSKRELIRAGLAPLKV